MVSIEKIYWTYNQDSNIWRTEFLLVPISPLFFGLLDVVRSWVAGFPVRELYSKAVAPVGVAIIILIIIFWIAQALVSWFASKNILLAWPILFSTLLFVGTNVVRPWLLNIVLICVFAIIASGLSVVFVKRFDNPYAVGLWLNLVYPLLPILGKRVPAYLFGTTLLIPIAIVLLPSRLRYWIGAILSMILVVAIGVNFYSLHRTPVILEREVSTNLARSNSPTNIANVILIVLDTARKDVIDLDSELSSTPNLRALARDGIAIRQFVANSSWTPPSHASMFTGLYPPQHGVFHTFGSLSSGVETTVLGEDRTTLAEILSEYSIYSAGFVANTYLRSRFGFHQGFNHYVFVGNDKTPLILDLFEKSYISLQKFFPKVFNRRGIERYNHNNVALSHHVFECVAEWLKQSGSLSPFFLFINVMDQHYIRYFPDMIKGGFVVGPKYYWESKEHLLLEPDRFKIRHTDLLMWHRNTMKYLDHSIGSFIRSLVDLDLYDQTTIIVTADHGNLFGEWGHYDHQTSIHDRNIAIPFIIKYAKTHAQRKPVVDRVYQQVDIFAEILDLFSIEPPSATGGTVFVHKNRHKPLSFLYRLPQIPEKLVMLDRDLCSTIVTIGHNHYQLIGSDVGHHEMYLLDEELYAVGKNLYERMKALPEVVSFIDGILELLDRSHQSQNIPKIDDETRYLLRSLGYIQQGYEQ